MVHDHVFFGELPIAHQCEDVKGIGEPMHGGHLGAGTVFGCYFFIFFLSGCMPLCLTISGGSVSIVDCSRVAAHRAGWTGDEIPVRGEGTSRSRGSSVAHYVLVEVDGSRADCLSFCL